MGVAHRTARISDWRDASQIPATSFAQIADGFICKSVRVSRRNISLELLVPRGGIELGEPIPKGGKFLAGETTDGDFDFMNGAHARKMSRIGFEANAGYSDMLDTPKACLSGTLQN